MSTKSVLLKRMAAVRKRHLSLTVSVSYEGQYKENCATRTVLEEAQSLSLFGEASGYVFTIRLPRGTFEAPINAGDEITITEPEDVSDGTEYIVLTAAPDELGALIRLDLGAINA